MNVDEIEQRELGAGSSCVKQRVLGGLFAALLLLGAPPATAQQDFEVPPTFRASEIVPPELLAGPNHRVAERVVNDGFMNIYTVNSRFGTFTANSYEELRIRVAEVNAIAEMETWSQSEQFLMGMQKAGRDVLEGSTRLIADPVQVLKDTSGGVKAIFASIQRNLAKHVGGEEDGKSIRDHVRDLIGYSLAKRQYAASFGVDPYSTNPVVQEYLDRLSRAGFAGDLGTKTALGFLEGGVGTAATVADQLQSLREEVRDKSPGELRQMNEKKLREMGVEPAVIELYLGNYVFSPTYQTAFVDILGSIDGVADRGEFVKVVVLAKDEDQALFRLNQARMYANHHEAVAPLEAFVLVSELVVVAAQTADGTLVVQVPADYVSFSFNLAGFFVAARSGLDSLEGIKRKQLWLAGGISPVARKWIEESGWSVHTHTRRQAPPPP
jgi:hypothetical protein